MPRVRNAAATRERLLSCAHKRFLNESYECVGLRDIAADAGVDVALVGRYFGSKEQLFKDVLRKDGADWRALAAQSTDLPSFFAELSGKKDASRNAGHVETLLIMLRSASSPQASALVRASFDEDVLAPVAGMLSGRNARMRAAMAMSVLMGTTIMRTIMNLDVLNQDNCEGYRNSLEKLLRTALAED